jgi:hypothetical protein
MTKKIIDADAFEKLVEWLNEQEARFDASIYEVKRKIEELATPVPETQESIFDADGWCWDLSLAPHNGCHLLLKNYISDDFFIMYDCYKNIDEDYWRSFSLPNEYKLWNGLKTDDTLINNLFKNVSLDEYEEVAWRPLPKLPNKV